MNEKYKRKSRRLAREMYWGENDKDEYICPDCGRREDEIKGSFEVHHKDGQPMDNRPENHVALCRACHNLREGKKPEIERIRNLRDRKSGRSANDEQETQSNDCKPQDCVANVRSVYLAGEMGWSGEDSYWSPDAGWRSKIVGEDVLETRNPETIHFDHGGDLVESVMAADMELLDKSDAILAYFSKDEQVGTLTELMHAVLSDKPALVVFNFGLIEPPAVEPPKHAKNSHRMVENPIGMRFESPVYWFLINYLIGEGSHNYNRPNQSVEIAVVYDKTGVKSAYKEWIKPAYETLPSPNDPVPMTVDKQNLIPQCCDVCGHEVDRSHDEPDTCLNCLVKF